MTYHWQCEECLEMNTFEGPPVRFIEFREETCARCGVTQIIEGVVDIDQAEFEGVGV